MAGRADATGDSRTFVAGKGREHRDRQGGPDSPLAGLAQLCRFLRKDRRAGYFLPARV
jgi:hypothetical protein